MRIADSRESDGRRLTGIWFELEALCQLSLVAIELVESCKLRVGSARTFGTLNGGWPRVGPSPRTTTCFEAVPVTMNPPMVTPAPVLTEARVEMFTSWAVGGSKARPEGSFSPEAKVLLAPAGVNLKILPLAGSASNRVPSASNASALGAFSPEAKVLLTPAGVNLKMVLPAPAANRLPEASKARATGPFSPEANVLWTPAGVNLKIVPVLKFASNTFPNPSIAKPKGPPRPVAKVLLAPTGVNLKIVPLPWSVSNRSPGAARMLTGSSAAVSPATVTNR